MAEPPKQFRIVLLGDIHVYRLWTWPWNLLGKRLLGQVNLWVNRRSRFDLKLLPAVVERVRELEPDLCIQIGDLTTTALHGEFELAANGLAPLLDNVPMFMLPGNHDRYTFTAARQRRFEQYFDQYAPAHYPAHRELGNGLHLIGLDATRPNPINASGRVGQQQLGMLKQMLGELGDVKGLIVACHYPLGAPPEVKAESAGHGLVDREELVKAMAEYGKPVLYVHGHVHEPWCWRPPEAPNVVAINAGAPIMRDVGHRQGQGLWEIGFDGSAEQAWGLVRHLPTEGGRWRTEAVDWPMRADK